jgi:hypothetical protein
MNTPAPRGDATEFPVTLSAAIGDVVPIPTYPFVLIVSAGIEVVANVDGLAVAR